MVLAREFGVQTHLLMCSAEIALADLARDYIGLGDDGRLSDTDLRRRITEEDAYFRVIREGWSAALRQAYLESAAARSSPVSG